MFKWPVVIGKLKEYLKRIGTPGPIRTGDLRIRSPALYPAELRAHIKLIEIKSVNKL